MRSVPVMIVAFASFIGAAHAAPTVDPGLKLRVFGDAYGGWQSAQFGAQQPPHRTFALNSPSGTAENGYSVSMIGLDLSWMSKGDAFGLVTSLRFGPSVPIYHGNDPALGIDNLTQGYVTFKATDALTVDVGQFNSIFGAEAIESFENLNYTRAVLFNITPYWHTGVRATYAVTDAFSVTAMAVNGLNTITEDDETPSVALQLGFAPSDDFSVQLGGMFAGDAETDPSGFDNYFDLIVRAGFGKTKIVFNAMYNINREAQLPLGETGNATLFGAALRIGQQLSEVFAIAARYEYFSDADNTLYGVPGAESVNLQTATLTLDVRPFKGYRNFVIRWDGRFETASEDIFADGDGAGTGTWLASVVGIAVYADVLGGQ